MDPVSIVVGALCQGATAALSNSTEAGLTGAYRSLVDKIRRRDPEAAQRVEAQSDEVVKAIESLREAVAALDLKAGDDVVQEAWQVHDQSHVTVLQSKGVVVGGYRHDITMDFSERPGTGS